MKFGCFLVLGIACANIFSVLGKDIFINGTGNKNIPVSFPYQKNDDFILDKILYQTSICGDDNFSADGSLKKYYGKSNFWITIAVK